MKDKRYWTAIVSLCAFILLFSFCIGHAWAARGVVKTIDTGYYNAEEMKQPKKINGQNTWNNGTYSNTKINKNNVIFSIGDKLAVGADLDITGWTYGTPVIAGNKIVYTTAGGVLSYTDYDTILKEEIILSSPVTSISWVLNLSVKPQSLGFSVDADGYSIRDPTNPDQRIKIPFPYVTDANGVKRTLSYSWNNGQRRVTLNQDFAGLTYPLTIDPVYVVDTTGYTGQWPIMLVNQSNYPQIIYASSTTSRIKLAVNNSGIITTASIGPATYFSGYQPMGAIINKTNDLPIVIYPGTATGNSINVTWFTNNWLGQEVNNFIAIGQKYGRLPAGQGKTNELLFANMNGSYGPFNITQVSGLSGSPPLTAKNYSILWQQLYRPIYSGKMNATNTLNIIWVLQTKINWTTVTDDNPPGLSTLVLSSGAINVSVAENGGMLMDINPITGFPGYSFIPATSSSGSTTGRAINYSYFDGTHWFYETAYENVTVGGMSSTKYADIAFNSSGTPYIAFVELANGASSSISNKYISYVKRLGANSWSPLTTIRGGVDTYPPSIAFDQQDGLHITWYNASTDDLNYYFEALPSAVAGSAPVAAFSCTPITGVMNLTDGPHFDTACTDASTETPTSYNWYIENATHAAGLSTSTVKNPIFNISFAGVYNISLLATNGAGSDWENKTHYVIVQNPNATVQYSIAPKYGNQSTTFTITDTSVCMNCTETAPSSWNTSFTQGLDSNISILKNIAGKKFPHNPAADSILYYLNRTVNDSVLTMWENSTWFNHTSYLDSPTIYKNQTPTASFTADSYSGARPFTVTFTGVQANPVKINSWNYSVRWGANVTTDFTNPVWSTTFGDTGTWTVLLSVANWTLGNETYTKLAYITVTDPAPPVTTTIPPCATTGWLNLTEYNSGNPYYQGAEDIFSNIRNQVGSGNYIGNYLYIVAGSTNDKFEELDRIIYIFDTSLLPNDAVITNAYLHLNTVNDQWNDLHPGGYEIGITDGTVTDIENVQTSDYDKFADNLLSDYLTFTDTTSPRIFTLNAAGKAWIDPTAKTVWFMRFRDDIEDSFLGVWQDSFEDSLEIKPLKASLNISYTSSCGAVIVPPEIIHTDKGATWIRWTFNNTVNRTPDLINDALDIFVDGLLFSQNSSVNYTSITDLQPGEWHYIEYRLKNLTGNNYTYIAKTSTQTYEATLWQPLILIFLCFLIGFYIPYILIGATIISFWAMIMSFLQTQQSYVVLMYAFLFIISLLAIAFGMGRKQ